MSEQNRAAVRAWTQTHEVPRPPIRTYCKVCKTTEADYVIVSPSGCAHHGNDYGETDCGKDATGDGWWWPA